MQFTGSETPAQIGKMTADACRALMRACGVKSLKDYGYDRDTIIQKGAPYVAASALCVNFPMEVTLERATWVMTSVYDDYQ